MNKYTPEQVEAMADAYFQDTEDVDQCGAMLRAYAATLTRIIESEATLSADYQAMVIQLGEVTAKLEAAERDAEALRKTLVKVAAVAVTQLFATHPDDVAAAFPLPELQRISEISAPLAAANASVESIYLEAWGKAMHDSAREGSDD